MTKAEVLLWGRIKNHQILGYKFRRQHGVGRFILDFYCAKLKLAIEIDGSHHAKAEIEEHDESRTKYLNDYNIIVLRYWNNEVINNIDGVCIDIENNINKINTPSVHSDIFP